MADTVVRDTEIKDKKRSYSDRICEEILSLTRKNACCRRAFLYGMLLGSGTKDEQGIRIRVRSDAAASTAQHLCKEQLGREAEFCRRKGASSGYIRFSSKAAEKMLFAEMTDEEIFRCAGCAGAFVGGLFVSCGSINDPQKDYYLSFRVANACAERVLHALSLSSVFMKQTCSGEKTVLYLRAKEQIEYVLGICGVSKGLFDLINMQIQKDMRNNANRCSNIEYLNIAKSMKASKKTREAIAWLDAHGYLTGLAPELLEAATLRMENPYHSLSSLGSMMCPPVTKSGVMHRLNKLVELYEKANTKENMK